MKPVKDPITGEVVGAVPEDYPLPEDTEDWEIIEFENAEIIRPKKKKIFFMEAS